MMYFRTTLHAHALTSTFNSITPTSTTKEPHFWKLANSRIQYTAMYYFSGKTQKQTILWGKRMGTTVQSSSFEKL